MAPAASATIAVPSADLDTTATAAGSAVAAVDPDSTPKVASRPDSAIQSAAVTAVTTSGTIAASTAAAAAAASGPCPSAFPTTTTAPLPTSRHSDHSLADEPRSPFASRFSRLWGELSASSAQGRRSLSVDAGNKAYPLPEPPLTSIPLNYGDNTRATKASSSRSTVTSQPVLVRTYSNVSKSRASSRAPSLTYRRQSMPSNHPAIPTLESFSFDGILRAIEPEIHETLDGIAEIYARSKLSLADDHGAHLPPQGEIAVPSRTRHAGLAVRTAGLERTLTTVTEASSSSERLAGGSGAGSVASGKGKVTAYGSLRGIISRGRSSSHGSSQLESPALRKTGSSSWSLASANKQPSITIKREYLAPNQISLASATEAARDLSLPSATQDMSNISTLSRPTSWFTWRASWTATTDEARPTPRLDAENTLKGVLQSTATSHGPA